MWDFNYCFVRTVLKRADFADKIVYLKRCNEENGCITDLLSPAAFKLYVAFVFS